MSASQRSLGPKKASHETPFSILGFALALAIGPIARAQALDQKLDKVTFATNWLAEAEHGGFYQALADGTYAKYGLDVTILQGGPQTNNRLLLAAGKIEFNLAANLIQSFDAAAQNIPIVAVASMFQKDPFILMSHPGAGYRPYRGPVRRLPPTSARTPSFRFING